MADNKITNEKEGLRSLVDYIERMSPLLEPEFRTEKHKITFLRNAVLPYSWAQFPISQISTARFTFYGFSTSLESCLTQHQQQSRSSLHTRYNESNSDDIFDTRILAPEEEYSYDEDENEDEQDPIHTHLNLYTKDPRYVRKSDYDSRGRGRRAFRGPGRNRYRNSTADRLNIRTRRDTDRFRPDVQI